MIRDEEGKEVIYEDSNKMIEKMLMETRFEVARGTRLVRIGTAYANSSAGGEVVAGFMGLRFMRREVGWKPLAISSPKRSE